MTSGKVQTNKDGVNVLVSTTNSHNRHYSSLNNDVKVVKVLSNAEILEVFENRDKSDDLELAKYWIRQQTGYAHSNCHDDTVGIVYSNIVQYKDGTFQ